MINPDLVMRAKQVSMIDYLVSKGHNPVKHIGSRMLFYSPIRNESTPSFWVDIESNKFKDFGHHGKGGDIIQLVQQVERASFPDAIHILQKLDNQPAPPPSLFLIGQNSPELDECVKAIKPISRRVLVWYIENRGVSIKLAQKYLKEVYYSRKAKATPFFALGLLNDKGGYELRSAGVKTYDWSGFKGTIGPKAITTIPGKNDSQVNIFEGMFDFLSALQYFKLTVPTYNTIILNGNGQLKETMPLLTSYEKINAFFDRDDNDAGYNAFFELKSAGLPVFDRSYIYDGYKDFNEFLQAYIFPFS